MPTLYDIKPRFQALLQPVANWLTARNLTPNQLTGAALALCLATGVALFAFPGNPALLYGLVPIMLVRMALNALDGMMARATGQSTPFGTVFNEIGDVVGDAVIYLPLAAALAPFQVSAAAVIAFSLLAVLAEFAGILGPMIGATRRYDGPLGKSDRAAAVAVLAIWAATGWGPAWPLTAAFWILALLCGATVLNRARAALLELDAAQ